MKKWNDWIRTWTVPQALVVGFGMACVTAMSITITLHDDWGRLVRWLAQPEAMALVGGIVLWMVGLYHRALKTPVTLLVLGLIGSMIIASTVVGCGGGLSNSQRTTLAAETQNCLVREREIVDRDSTEEQDRVDLATERARCDAARAAIVGAP
jgi:hypothetical protein